MQPLNLASSSVLKVFEHFDVDAFRAPLNSSLIRIVPTRAGRISAMQAALVLPHCEIYLLRTFPRIVDLAVPANHTVVLFSMVGTSDTIINGQPLDHPSLVLGRGPTDYRMVEGVQTCVAGIRFKSAMLAARDKAFLDTNLLDVQRARSFQNSLCQTYRRQAFGKLGKSNLQRRTGK